MRIDSVGRRVVQGPVAPVRGLRRPGRRADEERDEPSSAEDHRPAPDRRAEDDEGLGGLLDVLA